MRTVQWLVAATLALSLGGCASVPAGPTAEAKAALAPTGKLRVGVYLGNPLSAVRDPGSQEVKGMALDIGRELARRMGVPFEPVVYPSVGAMVDGAKARQWDVSFLTVSPGNARDFDFTAAHVQLDLGYLAAPNFAVNAAGEVDRPGVRVAVPEKGLADTILTGSLKQASVVRAPGLAAALDLVKSGQAQAMAALKPSLFELSGRLPGSRVLEGGFGTERVAMAIPKGRDAALPYVRKFIEDAKAEGLVKTALEKSGARGVVVAPPQ